MVPRGAPRGAGPKAVAFLAFRGIWHCPFLVIFLVLFFVLRFLVLIPFFFFIFVEDSRTNDSDSLFPHAFADVVFMSLILFLLSSPSYFSSSFSSLSFTS